MESDEPTEKQKSLRRLSRRRNRRVKVGANPGGEERSWAEYGGVGLTPSSDHKPLTRLILPIVCFGTLISVLVVLVGDWEVFNHLEPKETSLADTFFAYAIPALLVFCVLVSAVVILFGLKRFVEDLFSRK